MTEEQKKSKFNEMTGIDGGEEEQQEYVPQVIFTKDADLDLSQLQIPRLRLAQGMTPEVSNREASIGQFLLQNFPPHDEVDVIPLAVQNIREYRPDSQSPPVCQAPTGVIGIGTPGGDCSACPLSKWGEKDPKTGKSRPPACKNGAVLRAYSITHRTIFDFRFMGRNAGLGTFLQSQALAFGMNGFAVRLKSASVRNNLGSWYEPKIEMLPEIPEEHREISDRWYMAVQQQMSPSSVEAVKSIETKN